MQYNPVRLTLQLAALFVFVASSALAAMLSGSATLDGRLVSREASRNIVTTVDPVSPEYLSIHGIGSGYSGIAGLLITTASGTSICTGSLINGFQLVTAAHCVADENGNPNALGIQSVFFPDAGGQYVDTAASFVIHPDYTGSAFDEHDIAVINLGIEAPADLDRYGLYYGDATGSAFEFVGFGRRGQGETGNTIAAGTAIRGFNEFDALGIELFPYLGITTADSMYLFDFDNGLPENDAFGYWLGASYFGLGLGDLESMTAGGDSGGPSFVNGQIASVTSFGFTLSFTDPDTNEVITADFLDGLQSSFGEFGGNTSIAANRGWLESVMVPEPSTFILLGAGLLALGILRRRR